MRCPKCGYISFDHLETCLKCNKNIKSTSDELEGAVYNVVAPSFLKFDTSEQADEGMSEMDAFVADGDGIDDMEIEDPDLDILVDDDEDADEGGEIEFNTEEDSGFTLDLDGDEDEDEIGIDLGDQQDEDEISLDFGDSQDETFGGFDESEVEQSAADEETFTLDLPDELNDMSDLEAPAAAVDAADDAPAKAAAPEEEELGLDLDFDLDLGGDDLGSPAVEPEDTSGPIAQKDGIDDDFDLGSLEIEEPAPAQPAASKSEKKQGSAKLSLDDDLDFDLDLGDLTFDDK